MNRTLSESLLPINRVARRLGQLPSQGPPERRRLPRRSGIVRDAVLRALAEADRPLRAREIHAAAEALAQQPLSWNTVKDWLHTSTRNPGSPIERVKHGLYRHA